MIPTFFTKPMNTHPRRLDGVAELPEGLRRAAQAGLPPAAPISSIFYVPADYRSRGLFGYRYIPEQALIFTDGGVVQIVAGAGREAPASTFVPHDCVLYVQSSLLLLYGRLEVAAAGGAVARITTEYNTVGWHMLEPGLKAFIAAAGGAPAQGGDLAAARQRAEPLLEALPYKFANGVRFYGLTGCETLAGVVFQPAVWESGRWNIRQRQVVPNTLLALSDRHLFTIEEDRALFRRAAGRTEYGWIVTHMPLRAVREMHLAAGDGRQQLCIALALGGAQAERRYLLDDDAAQAWSALWAGAVR